MIDLHEGVAEEFRLAARLGRRWHGDEEGSAIHTLRSDSYLGLELSKLEGALARRKRRRLRGHWRRYYWRHREEILRRKTRLYVRARVAAELRIVPLYAKTVEALRRPLKSLPFVDSSRYGWATRRFGFYKRANDNQPRAHLHGQAADCIPDRALAQVPVVI